MEGSLTEGVGDKGKVRDATVDRLEGRTVTEIGFLRRSRTLVGNDSKALY